MTHRRLAAAAASGVALALGATVFAAAPASATQKPGTRPLAAVLLSDGNRFDRNSYDYDIVTEAALAVLEAETELAGRRPHRREGGPDRLPPA